MTFIPDLPAVRALRASHAALVKPLKPGHGLRAFYDRVADQAAKAESPAGWLRAHAANPDAPAIERGVAENLLAGMGARP